MRHLLRQLSVTDTRNKQNDRIRPAQPIHPRMLAVRDAYFKHKYFAAWIFFEIGFQGGNRRKAAPRPKKGRTTIDVDERKAGADGAGKRIRTLAFGSASTDPVRASWVRFTPGGPPN
jgi:hypothetical protein